MPEFPPTSRLPLAAICGIAPEKIPDLIHFLNKRRPQRKIGGLTPKGMRPLLILRSDYIREFSTCRAILEEGFVKGFAKGFVEGFKEVFKEGFQKGKKELMAVALEKLGRDQFRIAPPARILKRLRNITDQTVYCELHKAQSWEDWLS